MKTSSFALPLVLAAGGLAGCAGPVATARNEPVPTTQYQLVYVTGSHIPVRVPISPTARRAPTISPLAVVTPEEFVRLSAPTTSPMH